ncbi:hypothetical protein XAC3810_100152 [Xanthomonas citri pv. citri]|uniref:Uncharacterized protein n=1 Tax=Xanthomonas citri pv. citri TaxID=611301 RepID=A0A0U5GFU7_XANCI|nr:hypothetical protein XAC3824_120151 [Xanthomonas citri pv. citri]CEE16716.1 hypothetical protein XAC9322_110047 [Xanthomonas citri pv. citri]CEE17602.1 hypothetical protein XAC1083_110150 [Xanthomonas citri pv. citri]CEE22776.1 hypothetical protein XAC3810_100152 [Xanthomonas citri pv. citri]CEE22973.1 hypothetical protein XAC902_120019 [Xanthomonas citri pv. citri]
MQADAGLVAIGTVAATAGEAVGGIAAGEAVVEFATRHTGGDVGQVIALRAEGVADAAAQRRSAVELAGEGIKRGCRAEGADAVADIVAGVFGDHAIHPVAGLPVVAQPCAVFGTALVLATATGRSAPRRCATAETGRERIGTGRGADLVAVATIQIGIEAEAATGDAGRIGTADVGTDGQAGPVGRTGLRPGRGGQDEQDESGGSERGGFHAISLHLARRAGQVRTRSRPLWMHFGRHWGGIAQRQSHRCSGQVRDRALTASCRPKRLR